MHREEANTNAMNTFIVPPYLAKTQGSNRATNPMPFRVIVKVSDSV